MTAAKMHRVMWATVTLTWLVLAPTPALAHCDGLDGPVVRAARRALETRNLALALIWVSEPDEDEIRAVFEQALAVRELGPQAQALADRHFFETLVRVHRAGEGAAYTGLKPAGRDLGPAIPAADEALRVGSVEPVLRLLTGALRARLGERFGEVVAAKGYEQDDVAAGRIYVKAYVEYIHLVERLYESTTSVSHSHADEHALNPPRP